MPNQPIRRVWQDEADEKLRDVILHGGKGQVILPTGTGKTRIAINQMANHAIAKQRHGFYGVVVPRLLLSTQWIQEMASRFLGTWNQETNTVTGGLGIPVTFVVVSTGKVTRQVLDPIRACLYAVIGGHAAEAVTETTNPFEIRSEIAMRQRENKSTVVAITTYHSSSRLAEATEILPDKILEEKKTYNIGPIDICFFDECHYLVNGRLEEVTVFECAFDINSRCSIFMTATPLYTDDTWDWGDGIESKGMKNHARFGEPLIRKSFREMIEVGAIVAPEVYVIGSDETEDTVADGQNGFIKLLTCHYALSHLRNDILKNSIAPEKMGAKLLVVCDGQQTLKRIFNNKTKLQEFRDKNPGIKIFGLSSDYGCYIDGEEYDIVTNEIKDKLLLTLRQLGKGDEAIVFHVDMISEGLDVPGINAMLPFRNCSKSKLLQNLGRATRLHPEDAKRIFETGELKVDTSGRGKNYIKPHCNVYLPYLFEGRDDTLKNCIGDIITLAAETGFDPSDTVKLSFSYPAENPEEFPSTLARQARDAKLEKEIKSMHCEHVDKVYGLEKYRWTRLFFQDLTDQEIMQVIDATPPVDITPNINFG